MQNYNTIANNILSAVAGQSGVDSYVLLDDASFRTRLISLVSNNTRQEQAIYDLLDYVNNNY